MKPLASLGNVERAILLLDLFPEEMPALLAFSKETADSILSNPDSFKLDPVNLLHTTDMWVNLVKSAKINLEKYSNVPATSSHMFTEQFYEGSNYLFAFYCLHHYVTSGKCTNKQFIRAVELLFFFR